MDHRSTMAHPFPRLQTEAFWHRIPNPGYSAEADYNVGSMVKLREIYAGARFDDELFAYRLDPVSRERFRTVLVETYFAPEIQNFKDDFTHFVFTGIKDHKRQYI